MLEFLRLGFGFEGLDLVTDALVGSAALPFGLGGQWLGGVWAAAEFQAQLGGDEAFAAVAIALLRGVGRTMAMTAGEISVAKEKPTGAIAALANEYRTRLAETCSRPMDSDALSIS